MTTAPAQLTLWVEDRVAPAVVVAAGSLIGAHATALRRIMRRLTEREVPDIFVDLSRVDFVDADGLGVLAAAHRRAQSNGGRVTVLSPRPSLSWAMRLAGLGDMIWEGARAGATPARAAQSLS